jgi:hypothetical protein
MFGIVRDPDDRHYEYDEERGERGAPGHHSGRTSRCDGHRRVAGQRSGCNADIGRGRRRGVRRRGSVVNGGTHASIVREESGRSLAADRLFF